MQYHYSMKHRHHSIIITLTKEECKTPDNQIRIKHPHSKTSLDCNLAYGKKTIQHEKRLANRQAQKTSINIRLSCGCYGKYSNNKMEYKTMCMLHAHSTIKNVDSIVEYTGYKNIVGGIDYRNPDDDSKAYCKKVGYEISKQGCQGSPVNLAMVGGSSKVQSFGVKKAPKKRGKVFLIKK